MRRFITVFEDSLPKTFVCNHCKKNINVRVDKEEEDIVVCGRCTKYICRQCGSKDTKYNNEYICKDFFRK